MSFNGSAQWRVEALRLSPILIRSNARFNASKASRRLSLRLLDHPPIYVRPFCSAPGWTARYQQQSLTLCLEGVSLALSELPQDVVLSPSGANTSPKQETRCAMAKTVLQAHLDGVHFYLNTESSSPNTGHRNRSPRSRFTT